MPCAAEYWTCISRIGSTGWINLDLRLSHHQPESKPLLKVLAQDLEGRITNTAG